MPLGGWKCPRPNGIFSQAMKDNWFMRAAQAMVREIEE